jgi:hypothetical protein
MKTNTNKHTINVHDHKKLHNQCTWSNDQTNIFISQSSELRFVITIKIIIVSYNLNQII